jgi:hypothetical protein
MKMGHLSEEQGRVHFRNSRQTLLFAVDWLAAARLILESNITPISADKSHW